MIDLDDLEKKAEAATPGLWRYNTKNEIGPVSYEWDQSLGMVVGIAETWGDNKNADAEFIAAANPAVVLELIKELEEAREEIKFLKAYKQ